MNEVRTIGELPMPLGVRHALAKMVTVKDGKAWVRAGGHGVSLAGLAQFTDQDLAAIPGLGKKRLALIRDLQRRSG